MDSKNRKNLDVKYLHPFSPAPSHNGHRHSGSSAEGNPFLKINSSNPFVASEPPKFRGSPNIFLTKFCLLFFSTPQNQF